MNIIVDTDALLGIFNPNDFHHKTALSLTRKLVNKKGIIFILPTTLCEFALLSASKIGRKASQVAVKHLIASKYLSIDITQKFTEQAVTIYQKQTSHEESLFDCFIIAACKVVPIDAVFSFDKGYKKNGLKLVTDLILENN